MPDWRVLLRLLREEVDEASLKIRIDQLEEAIFYRSQELARTGRDCPELREIKNAVDELWQLKIRKLGWPDPLAPERDFTSRRKH